ncbi:hypothetical protein HFX_4013 (plasmid) [Haloferax mediterranei ATCC 33500]|uniref:Uncharacterized protein n=1 Tax=Haloferax mediterranei (strain ATCC 33500 / DSM 1411 / JCM 8866 / NBRC 14739 / NCIMB 2177 / R-4) TaxID=523841 RepID=I3R8Z9_HALMT|nr:hypothetical protein HFX_4013 [Haloferax mediterranei ATCC 33500]
MNRGVDGVLRDVRGEHLAHRHLDAGLLTGRDSVSGVADHRSSGVESRLDIGDIEPYRLLVRERPLERSPLIGVRLRHVERALGHPGEAHAVGETGRAESLLGDGEPCVLRAEQVLLGDSNAFVSNLRVTDSGELAADVGNVPLDADARRVRGNEEERTPLVRVGVLVGPGHHQQDVGLGSLRRPPLVTVDDPFVSVLLRSRPNHLGVRPGPGLGFGHRETRLDVTLDQRFQPPLLLFVRPDQFEGVHVALVRRVDANGRRTEEAPPGCLEDREHLAESHSHPAVLLGDLRGVHVVITGFLAEFIYGLVRDRSIAEEFPLDGDDLLLDEGPDSFGDLSSPLGVVVLHILKSQKRCKSIFPNLLPS